ncbi:hypothetical protein BZA77DRAFT_298788 [Pyronema omphalodes]|nr:hypothetical protein BZA77DRAFT_298788 [Pyronema omphalodes]
MPDFTSTISLRTVFDYTAEAVDKVLRQYKIRSQYSALIECRFYPVEQEFVLEGDASLIEYAWCDLWEIVQNMVVEESRRKNTPSELMQRSMGTRSQYNTPQNRWNDSEKAEEARSTGVIWTGLQVISSNDSKFETATQHDISGYKLVRYWKPSVTQEEFNLMLNLEGFPTVPDQLQQLCDCAVFPDWVKRQVKITASDEKTLDLVLHKLQVVEEFFKRGFSPISTTLINVEDKTKFLLRFVAMAKQQNKLRSMMFECDSKWNRVDPTDLYSLRVYNYVEEKREYKPAKLEIGSVHTAGATEDHRDWKDYEFSSRSPETVSPVLTTTAALRHRHIEPVDLVATYIAPEGEKEGTVQGADLQSEAETATNFTYEKTRRRIRVKQSTTGTESEILDGQYSEDVGNIVSTSSSVRTEMVGDSSTASSTVSGRTIRGPEEEVILGPRPEVVVPALVGNSAGASTRRPKEKNVFKSSAEAASESAAESITLGPRPATPVDQVAPAPGASTRRPKQSKKPVDAFPEPVDAILLGPTPSVSAPSLETMTTRRPREKKPEGSAVELVSKSADNVLLGPGPGQPTPGPDDVISLGPKPGSSNLATVGTTIRRPREKKKPAESVEEASEASTRKVISTMNQKMAPPLRGNGSGETLRGYNAKHLNQAMLGALEFARAWSGELKIEAKLGRLVFLDVPRNIAKKQFGWQDFRGFLSADLASTRSTFSRCLTTQHYDVEFIRDLKIPGGNPMFSNNFISRKVTYDFEIVQTNQEQIKSNKKRILSINGETWEATLYGEGRTFVSINMSNPLRTWDYRVDFTGKKRMNLENNPSIKAIYNSIISAGGKNADIIFAIEAPALEVSKITLKCETKHLVHIDCGVPMELVTTEVQNLMISESKDMDNIFRAKALSKAEMKREGRYYWTASIIPTQANETLKKNSKLEIGALADWTAADVLRLYEESGMLMPSIMNVMNQIVSKVDNVGYDNVYAY